MCVYLPCRTDTRPAPAPGEVRNSWFKFAYHNETRNIQSIQNTKKKHSTCMYWVFTCNVFIFNVFFCLAVKWTLTKKVQGTFSIWEKFFQISKQNRLLLLKLILCFHPYSHFTFWPTDAILFKVVYFLILIILGSDITRQYVNCCFQLRTWSNNKAAVTPN